MSANGSPKQITAENSAAVPFVPASVLAVPEVFARDATIAWFRGEFAAANAIIDCLCSHIAQITNGSSANDAVFAAIHRRRVNWIPVLQMQKYYSIADIVVQLRESADRLREMEEEGKKKNDKVVEDAGMVEEKTEVSMKEERVIPSVESSTVQVTSTTDANGTCGGSFDSGMEGGSSQEDHSSVEKVQSSLTSDDNVQICTDHDQCVTRRERIKTCKGFMAKEPVKGHMMNVVKGLKMYEEIFMESELSKLAEFVTQLRAFGRNGKLSGETFMFFNKELKGNKREVIQLGAPIFQSTKEEETSDIEPIPSIIQNAIDHLCQWRLIPESRKPNSCVINFFDEGEFSQPYFKPPHLDNPISTLFLSETSMVFGRVLAGDQDGNYKGSLTLPVKQGSLIVMRGNSADMARHVVCPSQNTRVCITFLKVRSARNIQPLDSPQPLSSHHNVALWSPEASSISQPLGGYITHGLSSPTWPVMMVAPSPMLVHNNSNSLTRKPNRGGSGGGGGTGVFLPWTVGPKKYIKHLPPRIQKRRLHSSTPLPPPLDLQVDNASQIPCIAV